MNKKKLRDLFVKIRFRMTIANPFISALNFIIVVIIANTQKFNDIINIPTIILVPLSIIIVYSIMWSIGYILDSKFHIVKETKKLSEVRSPIHLENWEKIQDELDNIIYKLKKNPQIHNTTLKR